jgi:hypothetical protein
LEKVSFINWHKGERLVREVLGYQGVPAQKFHVIFLMNALVCFALKEEAALFQKIRRGFHRLAQISNS